MTDFPPARRIATNGIELAVHEAGPESGPAVVLVHGWPEIAYSWKNQIGPLAAAGYRVIAPNVRGFDGSDAPEAVESYDIRHLTDDLAGLLDALGLDQAIFVGHDWGGLMVWPMARLHPGRVAGVVGVCTPHSRRPEKAPTEMLKERFTLDHYMLRFQEEGVPERAFEGRERQVFEMMFRHPAPREIWPKLFPSAFELLTKLEEFEGAAAEELVLSEKDLEVYVETYAKSGWRGGINLYRNLDRNWRLLEDVDETVRQPALMVTAELDMFLPAEMTKGMEKRVPDLEVRSIPGCGHWVTWQAPDALNAHLLDWLARRFPA